MATFDLGSWIRIGRSRDALSGFWKMLPTLLVPANYGLRCVSRIVWHWLVGGIRVECTDGTEGKNKNKLVNPGIYYTVTIRSRSV